MNPHRPHIGAFLMHFPGTRVAAAGAVPAAVAVLLLLGASPPAETQTDPSILFVSRKPVRAVGAEEAGAIPGFGPHHRTAVTGGRLMVRRPGGSIEPFLRKALLHDVADPDVSWDGRTVVFAAVEHPDSSWRIWSATSDGRSIRKLTRTDRNADLGQLGAAAHRFVRYDDFDPCFLPDGRIVFASTRYPSLASLYAVPASNLFVMTADGDSMRRITTERNGAEEPTIDPVSGRVVYARWWLNLDRPSNVTRDNLAREDAQALTSDIANIWQAVTITPDGDEVKLYAGFPRTREGLQTYKPAVTAEGRLLSVYTEDADIHPGPAGTGIRWFNKGADYERPVLGARPGGPPGARATDPHPLRGGGMLIAYAPAGDDFGIYRCSMDGTRLEKIADLRGSHELEPQVLAPRPRPPVIADRFLYRAGAVPPTEDPGTHLRDDTFRFDCMNVYANGAVDEPMPDAPRIARDASIRFFMNMQRQSAGAPDPSIHLKDAPVFANGAVHEHDLPAEVPLFEMLVDGRGKVLESPGGRFAHVAGFNYERQGAGTKCVGCHVGHSVLEVPVNGMVAEWFNAAPSAAVSATSAMAAPEGEDPVPQRVVDRQARTGGDSVYWAAMEEGPQTVRLRWTMPLQMRELVLYAVSPDAARGTDSRVLDCEVSLHLAGRETHRVGSTGAVAPAGTTVRIPPTVADEIAVTVRRYEGGVRGRRVAALAEIETIARIHQETQ